MQFLDRFYSFIQRIENSKKPFIYWVLLVYGVALARALLDAYLGTSKHFPNPIHLFLHVPLWNLNFLLAIAIILHLATKEKIAKTTKAVFGFSLIFLIVPLVDYTASGGQGIMLEYAMDPSEAIATIIPLTPNSVTTPGQGIAGLLAIATAIFYIIKKNQPLLKALVAGLGIYLSGIFFGIYPAFLTTAFNLPHHFTPKIAAYCYFFLVLAATIQSSVILWLHNKKQAKALFKNTHFLRVIHYLLLVVLGAISATYFYPNTTFNTFTLSTAIFSIFLAFQASLVFNNIADKEIPKNVKEKDCWKIALALLILSQFAAFLAGWIVFVFLFFATVIGLNYSLKPLRLKRLGWANNIIIGLLSTLVLTIGFLSQLPSIKAIPLELIVAFFVTFSLSANIKDLKDFETDKKNGIKTLPVLLGMRKGILLTAILTSISFPIIPLSLGFKDLLLVSLVFGLANFILLIKTKKEIVTFVTYFYFASILAVKMLSLAIN